MIRDLCTSPRAGAPAILALAAAALLASLCVPLPSGAAGPVRLESASTIALTQAIVHTVSGPTLENATILIQNGRIAAVGTDFQPPADAQLVLCQGKHVYPGFIAPNTVLGLTEVMSVSGTNDYRETGEVNPDIRAEVEFNPESELLAVTRLNGVTAALVVPRGGVIAGTSAVMHLAGWTYEDMTVRAPVGLHVMWPNMTPSRAWYETRSEEEQKKAREAALDNLRRAFDDARAYWKAREAEGKAGIPRHDRDVRWDAMGKALRGEIPVMIHASALNQIRAALRFVDEQKLPRVILVGGADAWRIVDEIKARKIAVICDPTLALPRRTSDPYDEPFTLPAKLAAAGIPFCIGDGGNPFGAANTRNLPYQAAMAAAFGLPKEEALKAITLYPAQILGVADRLGSIEVGKAADLVIADGDPLRIVTQVLQVYINGKLVPVENRQTRLFYKYDAKPRGPLARPRPK